MKTTKRDITRPQIRSCDDCAHHRISVQQPREDPPQITVECKADKVRIYIPRAAALNCKKFERSRRCCECVHNDIVGSVMMTVWCMHARKMYAPAPELRPVIKCRPVKEGPLPYSCEQETRMACNHGCEHFIPRDKPLGEEVPFEGFIAGI